MLALALRRVRGSTNVRCPHNAPPRYPQCALHPPAQHSAARMLGTGGHARHSSSPCGAVAFQLQSTFRSAGRCGATSTTLRHCNSRAHQPPSDATHTGQEEWTTPTAQALHAHEHPSSDEEAHMHDNGSEVSVLYHAR